MKYGFISVAAASPEIRVADCVFNGKSIVSCAKKIAAEGAAVIVFPQLSVTGYSCGDLFFQGALQKGVDAALAHICEATADLDAVLVVGAPLIHKNTLYNCAVVLYGGEILGVVPKTNIPNYGAFYELRHFQPYTHKTSTISLLDREVPIGTDLLFSCKELPEFTIGVEIGEDLWVPSPPSARLAQGGATVICNLSASDETIGKAQYCRSLVRDQSARLLCAYVYADACEDESTSDLVFAGHNMIGENGTIIDERAPFCGGYAVGVVDVKRLASERRRMNTFTAADAGDFTVVPFDMKLRKNQLPELSPMPFVPADADERALRCEQILEIQSRGLARRIRHTNCKTLVLGVSGGLDSTLAMLVCQRALNMLGRDPRSLIAVTMPGFGTTQRTRGNAEKLAELMGADLRVIPIGNAVAVHFEDIGHDPNVADVVFENAQARERTQVLMDLANKTGGLVVGTGDLSELALGWATYNGDHMSMYSVNGGVPKTLIRHIVAYAASVSKPEMRSVLLDILDTPVSPELLPAVDGEIAQKTEDLVGPYELHDFFLFYTVRCGFSPRKIFYLARHVFAGVYDEKVIIKWLGTFCRRFFNQQFKRSCLPDGPKVGSVSLSPRGDWRMPSDACSTLWMAEVEALEQKL